MRTIRRMSGSRRLMQSVRRKILRRLRPRSLCKIGRRANNRHAHVRSDAHRDHVFCNLFAEADAGVITLCDDVCQAVVDNDLDVNVGVLRQDLRQCRPKNGLGRVLARRDPNGCRRVSRAVRSRPSARRRSHPNAGPRSGAGARRLPLARRCGWCGSSRRTPESRFEFANGVAERTIATRRASLPPS